MELLTNLFAFVCGMVTGGLVIGVLSGKAYDKGYKDRERELRLPPDVKRAVEDWNKINN